MLIINKCFSISISWNFLFSVFVASDSIVRIAMAVSEVRICFICEKILDKGEILEVQEKGVKTLLASSVKKINKNHEHFLKNLKKVTVHSACQKHYNNKKLIAAAKRRDSNVVSLSLLSTSLRSATSAFDF